MKTEEKVQKLQQQLDFQFYNEVIAKTRILTRILHEGPILGLTFNES